MAATSNKIFISYRREDAVDIAGRIRDWLIRVQRIPTDDVFMDVTAILPGADFVQQIADTIGQCRAMIVVISPSWLAQVNAPDTSYVRVEAETALSLNVPVIPVLVGGAQMPSAEQLPEGLRSLMRRNVRAVRSTDFDYDMEWVGRALGSEPAVQTQVAVPSIPPVSRNPGRSPIIIAGVVVVLLAIVFATLSSIRGGGSTGGNGGGSGYVSDTRTPQASRAATATEAPTQTATATATATAPGVATTTTPWHTYYAQRPGPSPCDAGGAQWSSEFTSGIDCSSSKLHLTGMAANQQLEGWVKCTGIPGGVGGFPSAFNLSVTVSAIQGNTTITIGTSSVYYTINIQTNNYSIYADSATAAQSSTYNGTGATNVLVSLRGGMATFSFNGTQVGTFTAAQAAVHSIELGVNWFSGGSSPSADFEDFQIVPIT